MQSKAGSEPVTVSVIAAKSDEPAVAKALLIRLDKIKTMDISGLSASERKQLRKEVRTIQSQLREIGGGVYLSVGAIIIIILILILLV